MAFNYRNDEITRESVKRYLKELICPDSSSRLFCVRDSMRNGERG